jgi:hypothetical protein
MGMAAFICVRSRGNPAGRIGRPHQGGDKEAVSYGGRPWDHPDLHGRFCAAYPQKSGRPGDSVTEFGP